MFKGTVIEYQSFEKLIKSIYKPLKLVDLDHYNHNKFFAVFETIRGDALGSIELLPDGTMDLLVVLTSNDEIYYTQTIDTKKSEFNWASYSKWFVSMLKEFSPTSTVKKIELEPA